MLLSLLENLANGRVRLVDAFEALAPSILHRNREALYTAYLLDGNMGLGFVLVE
jgi:hypothetical protein